MATSALLTRRPGDRTLAGSDLPRAPERPKASRCRAIGLSALLALSSSPCVARAAEGRAKVERADRVVAQDGSGDFTSVQQALDAIPKDNASHKLILVRNGIYREKLFVTASHVSVVGEDRERTRIEYAELRRNWRESHPDDWGAAVVNIGPAVTDLVIANLTVRNDYGGRDGDHDHQFAIRSMGGATRIAILHANVVADGGDTLSLWNDTTGLSYLANCHFEGYVDYVCPRGWSFITDSRFFGRNLSASIWHDGSKDKDQKLVIRRSRFDGVEGFPLGRNHRDAQFYLLDASFSKNMADRPIYRAQPDATYQWAPRYYYSNCHREGGDFAWFADNLDTARGAPREEEITAAWTFGGRWDPEATLPSVLPFAALPRPPNEARGIPARPAVLRFTAARNARAHRIHFGTKNPPPFRKEQQGTSFETGRLAAGTTYHWRVDEVTSSGIVLGPGWSFATRGGVAPARPGAPAGGPAATAAAVAREDGARWPLAELVR